MDFHLKEEIDRGIKAMQALNKARPGGRAEKPG